MPVTPQDCTKPTSEEQAQIAELERRIDAYLRERYRPGEPVYFDIRNVSGRILPILIRDYGQSGWAVEYVSDQRDGDALKFTAGSEQRARDLDL